MATFSSEAKHQMANGATVSQSVSPNESFSCTRLLQEHACMDYPGTKSVTSFTAPFDRLQHSQLCLALESDSELLIANALASATSGILASCKLPTISLRLQEVPGLLDNLMRLAVSGSSLSIQRMSLQLLVRALSSFSENRVALLHVLTPTILAAMDSADGRMRSLAYEGVAAVAETYAGATLAVELQYCAHIVRRMRHELVPYAQGDKAPLNTCLHALDRLLAGTHTDAAEQCFCAGAVPVLVEVLHVHAASPLTLATALQCLAALTTLQEGKEALVQEEKTSGALVHVMTLCAHRDPSVVGSAAYVMTGALMEDAAKRSVMEAGKGLAPILDAAELKVGKGPELQVIQARIAACSALATVAGHPHARELLTSAEYRAQDRLQAVAAEAENSAANGKDGSGTKAQLLHQLAAVARRACDAIEWVP